MLKRLIELGGGVLAEMRLEDEMMMEERLDEDEKKKKIPLRSIGSDEDIIPELRRERDALEKTGGGSGKKL